MEVKQLAVPGEKKEVQIMKRKIKNNFIPLLFSLILLVQAISLLIIFGEKAGFHIDEIYSYILSNSYDTDRISHSDKIFDRWITGDDLKSFATVEQGNEFAYQRVFYNNSLDAHPPLYYCILHTICSIFVGEFSKWFGLSINLLFFALTQVIIYFFGVRLFGKQCIWSIVAPVLYGGTALAFHTASFIRMYMMLTFLTTLILFISYQMCIREVKISDFFWCFFVTFSGVFTQYLIGIIAFFVSAFMCVRFYKRKEFRNLIFYFFAMLSAVLLVFILYPAAIVQITGSETNNIGNEVSRHFLIFSDLFYYVVKVTLSSGYYVFGNIWKAIIFSAVFGIAVIINVCCMSKNKTSVMTTAHASFSELSEKEKNIPLLLAGLLIFLLSYLTVIHISGKYATVRYIYNLVPFGILLGIYLLHYLIKNSSFLNCTAVILLVMGILSTFFMPFTGDQIYLFQEKYNREIAIDSIAQNTPMLVLNNGSTYFLTANYIMLHGSNDLYICNYNSSFDIDSVMNELNKSISGILIVVLTDQDWSNGFDSNVLLNHFVNDSHILDKYELLDKCDFGEIYRAYGENFSYP